MAYLADKVRAAAVEDSAPPALIRQCADEGRRRFFTPGGLELKRAKPRIRLWYYGRWICQVPAENMAGLGKTPADAYRDWSRLYEWQR